MDFYISEFFTFIFQSYKFFIKKFQMTDHIKILAPIESVFFARVDNLNLKLESKIELEI